jgi:hypothetical protein
MFSGLYAERNSSEVAVSEAEKIQDGVPSCEGSQEQRGQDSRDKRTTTAQQAWQSVLLYHVSYFWQGRSLEAKKEGIKVEIIN